MKFKTSIIKLPDKEYLVIRGFLSWGKIKPEDLPEWNEKYGFPDKSRLGCRAQPVLQFLPQGR